jgi:hypothetical protein
MNRTELEAYWYPDNEHPLRRSPKADETLIGKDKPLEPSFIIDHEMHGSGIKTKIGLRRLLGDAVPEKTSEKTFERWVSNPGKMPRNTVLALCELFHSTLDYLQGFGFSRDSTVSHEGIRELCSLYEELEDDERDALWRVASALSQEHYSRVIDREEKRLKQQQWLQTQENGSKAKPIPYYEQSALYSLGWRAEHADKLED